MKNARNAVNRNTANRNGGRNAVNRNSDRVARRREAVARGASEEAERLLEALDAAPGYRNGRLALDWMTRRQVPRWRLVKLDGTWYDPVLLRSLLASRPGRERVPATGRPLTQDEWLRLMDPNPWRLS